MRRWIPAGGLLGLLMLVFGLWLGPAEKLGMAANPIKVIATPEASFSPVVHATGVPQSYLSHTLSPDADVLRNAPDRQAIYDAEAIPGQFVTPPNVSEAHNVPTN